MGRRRNAKDLLVRELALFRRALGAVRRSPNPPRIHELRVAGRRARASIRLLARKMPDDLARAMRSFFVALSKASGPARDFDVAFERSASRGDAPAGSVWVDARALAGARLVRHAAAAAPEWRRIEKVILTLGVRKRGKVENRWRKRRAAQLRELEAQRRRLAKRLSVAAVHAWRRCARRLRFEAEIARDAGLPIGRALATAKAIHRGTAEVVDLAMIGRLARQLEDRSLAPFLRESIAGARRVVARLTSGERKERGSRRSRVGDRS